MKLIFKIPSHLLVTIRTDLQRQHPFAHERVGFLTAGATRRPDGSLLLLAREYQPVADEDYVPDPTVGAQIGPKAFTKALQLAYSPRSSLFHIHTHGGHGTPAFSHVDLASGADFVPGLFNAIASHPHGLIVLSDDSATALVWFDQRRQVYARGFVSVGAPQRHFGG